LTQQRILDQMKEGIWYEGELRKDRTESCRALVSKGLCEMARVACIDENGKLPELSTEQMLLNAILGQFKEQPCEMYRIVKTTKQEAP
jgi:hypothetical protein